MQGAKRPLSVWGCRGVVRWGWRPAVRVAHDGAAVTLCFDVSPDMPLGVSSLSLLPTASTNFPRSGGSEQAVATRRHAEHKH